jgi:membrane protein required for colicin V production
MIIDGIIGISLALAFIRGWKKGILWAVASLAAVVLGSLVSLKLAHRFSVLIQEQNIIDSRYTLVLSYILLFLLVMYGLRFLIKMVEKLMQSLMLGWINRLAGGLLYILFSAFMLSSIFWLTNEAGVLTQEAKAESQLYSIIEPLAPQGIELGGEVLPFLKDLYQDVGTYLSQYE